MNQYEIATLGDQNPADHGGGYLLLVREHGEDRPYLEFVVWEDGDEEDAKGRLYGVPVDENVWTGLCSWVKPRDRDRVAAFVGLDSEDPQDPTVQAWRRGTGTLEQRARIILDVASYHGWVNLDEYPIEVDRETVRRRWANLLPAEPGMAARFSSS